MAHDCGNVRYLWPSECDLKARLAGLELEERFADPAGRTLHRGQ